MNARKPMPRALVIDDEPDIRDLLSLTLRRMQVEVETAGEQAGAIRRLAAESFGELLRAVGENVAEPGFAASTTFQQCFRRFEIAPFEPQAVGFLGAFTTFSTFEYETNYLLTKGEWAYCAANVFGSLLVGLIAVRVGLYLGRSL